MKITRKIAILFSFLFLLGCSKEIQIDGVAFSTDKEGVVTTYKGMKVYFLAGPQKAAAERFLQKWRYDENRKRIEKYNDDLAIFEKERERYNNTPAEKRNPYTRKKLEDDLMGLKVQSVFADTSDDYPHHVEEFKELIRGAYFVITDQTGEFSATLKNGEAYLIIAEGTSPPRDDWFFEYIAGPMKLVLTDANSIYSE